MTWDEQENAKMVGENIQARVEKLKPKVYDRPIMKEALKDLSITPRMKKRQELLEATPEGLKSLSDLYLEQYRALNKQTPHEYEGKSQQFFLDMGYTPYQAEELEYTYRPGQLEERDRDAKRAGYDSYADQTAVLNKQEKDEIASDLRYARKYWSEYDIDSAAMGEGFSDFLDLLDDWSKKPDFEQKTRNLLIDVMKKAKSQGLNEEELEALEKRIQRLYKINFKAHKTTVKQTLKKIEAEEKKKREEEEEKKRREKENEPGFVDKTKKQIMDSLGSHFKIDWDIEGKD